MPTDTVWLRDVEQPALLVSITEYVVVVLGLTVIDGVVAPFDQRMLEMLEPLTVSVTEPPGWHMLAGPLIVAAGAGLTVTVTGEDVAEQPPALVTVTL